MTTIKAELLLVNEYDEAGQPIQELDVCVEVPNSSPVFLCAKMFNRTFPGLIGLLSRDGPSVPVRITIEEGHG